MRNSIVITLSVVSTLALSACGGAKSHQSAQAKVAAAKVTGNKKQQANNFDEISKEIEAKRAQLRKIEFYSADDKTTGAGVLYATRDAVVGRSQRKNAAIQKELTEMSKMASALVDSAKDLGNADKVKQAELTKQNIEKAQEKVKTTPGVASRLFSIATFVPVHGYNLAMSFVPVTAPDNTEFGQVNAQIEESVAKLNALGYHDQDPQYSVAGLEAYGKSFVKSQTSQEIAQIKAILETIEPKTVKLQQIAKEQKDETKVQKANYLNSLVKQNLADLAKEQKQIEKAEFKAKNTKPVVFDPYLTIDGVQVSH